MKKILCLLLSLSVFCSFQILVSAKRIAKENENVEVNLTYSSDSAQNKDSLPVEIKAKSAVLMDVKTGKILLEYNGDEKLYPASVTKVMTMLLVCEALDAKKITLTDKVACSANAASKGGSQIWLEEGEAMTVDELLRATVIGSANDAATLLGEHVAGSEAAFIDLMNKRARELGMKNTNFENATGLDDTTDAHLTTARDIALMSKELLKYEMIIDYTTVWMDSLRDGETELVNTNKLVRFYEGTTGLKTGTTAKAGCCISASAMRNDLHLVAVVMGSENSNDRFNTAKAMLNWGFSNYTCYKPEIDKKLLKAVDVIGGKDQSVKVEIGEVSPILLKKGEEGNIKTEVKLKKSVEAPVEKGQKLGSVKFYSGNEVVGTIKITAKKEVEKLQPFDCFKRLLSFLLSGNREFISSYSNA